MKSWKQNEKHQVSTANLSFLETSLLPSPGNHSLFPTVKDLHDTPQGERSKKRLTKQTSKNIKIFPDQNLAHLTFKVIS